MLAWSGWVIFWTNLSRSSIENMEFLFGLMATPTMRWWQRLDVARWMMSRWPTEGGSKEPAYRARISFPVCFAIGRALQRAARYVHAEWVCRAFVDNDPICNRRVRAL